MKAPTVAADFGPCGGGQGADCCLYLVVGSKGFECGREDRALKRELERRRPGMTAQRMPALPFPACQGEGWSGGAR